MAGVDVGARVTVADDPGLLESAFRSALGRARIVIATGGLGPTEDDLTREAAAAALGRGLRRDPGILEALRARFARYGRVMAPVNEKQADLIEGAVMLPNPLGSACGQAVEADGRLLVLLPGPPHEMQPMFEQHVLPGIRERAKGALIRTRVLRIASMSESDVEQVAAPIYKTFTNPRTTILAQRARWAAPDRGSPAEAVPAPGALAKQLASPTERVQRGRLELPEVVAGSCASASSPSPSPSPARGACWPRLPRPRRQRVSERGYGPQQPVEGRSPACPRGPSLAAGVGEAAQDMARARDGGADRHRSGHTVTRGPTAAPGQAGWTGFIAADARRGDRVGRSHSSARASASLPGQPGAMELTPRAPDWLVGTVQAGREIIRAFVR